ncbi:hypothetical protein ACFX13_040983 [Malus domestica]
MSYDPDDTLAESTFRRRNLASWIIATVPEVQAVQTSQSTSFTICICPSSWIITGVLHGPMPSKYHLYSTVTEPVSTVGPTEVDSQRTLVLEKDKKIQEFTAELWNEKRLCTTYQEQLRNKKFSLQRDLFLKRTIPSMGKW